MIVQERIPTCVYQISLTSYDPKVLTLLRQVLAALRFSDDQCVDEMRDGQMFLCVYSEDKKHIDSALQLIRKLKIVDLRITTRALKPKDWLTRWKAVWKPGALTRHIDIVPVWHRKSYKVKKSRSFILMDTLLSFGTGLHETTRIVAQMIEDHKGQYDSFCDIGTGTGVLAMVASIYGAQDIVALDIGELSVEAALSNLALNKIKAKVVLADIGRYRNSQQYDFVAANLITHDLIAHRRRIVSLVKPQGLLAVSGISLERLNELKKGFSDLPLKPLQIEKGKEWAGVLFRKM